MIDIKKREKGKYVEEHIKIKEGIKYKMIETFVIGRDFTILSYSREYKPGIKFPIKWEDI